VTVEYREDVLDNRGGLVGDLFLAVAADAVAVAAEPEVAVVVGVGLMPALVLAAVEFDDEALLGL